MSPEVSSIYLFTHLTRSRDDSNAQGNAMFKIGAYYYGADQNIDKVLFFTFGSQKIEFYAGMFHNR